MLGQHIVSVSDRFDLQMDLLAKAYDDSLGAGHRCFFLGDRTQPAAFVAAMANRGRDIGEAVESGQFRVLTAQETYLRGDYFDADRMLDFLDETVSSSAAEGFAGCCIAGEATWLSRGVPGVDRLLEYEYRVNSLPTRSLATFVCLYEAHSLPAWMGPELLRIHPTIHLGDSVSASRTYVEKNLSPAEIPLAEELEPPADGLPCTQIAELISAYVDGELAKRRREEIANHLRCCDDCQALLDSFHRLKVALAHSCRPLPSLDFNAFLSELRSRLSLSSAETRQQR
ncbi:MAG: MEDS domain-containing protein [Candidatus Zipacnadales bacterium]